MGVKRSFRYDPELKEMVEIHRTPVDFEVPGIIDDIHPFISPVDGTVIKSRSHLRDYMGARDLVFYDEVKDGKGKVEDRYAQKRADTALRERLWEGLDKAMRGRSPDINWERKRDG